MNRCIYLELPNHCFDILFLIVLQHLNTNHTLYDAVKKAEKEGHLLTEEARKAAHYLRVDFERGGIHLCPGINTILSFFLFLVLPKL